jgi:hypothetical protein
MKPVDETIPRITSDGLALILGGRTYGEETKENYFGRLLQMGVPREIDALADILVTKSQLLALSTDSEKAVVYDAYGHDLALLVRYRDAFKACIEAAVKARAAPDQKDAQAFLDRIVDEVAPIQHKPSLNLGSEALKLDATALLPQLQGQFRADIESLKQNVAVWFHVLAESECVSLIEWFNPTALRYYFFRMESTRDEIDRAVERTGNLIDGVTTTTTTKTRVRLFSERRTHTVVKARARTPESYTGRVPKRIALLVDRIPAEMRPFVTIIDGHVTHEEVHRRITSSNIEIETRSVYRPDPAIALFNTWAINGWGGSTSEVSQSIYRGHPLSMANKILIASLVATVASAVLVEPFGSIRASAIVAAIGIILTGLSQLGMRLENSGK